MINLKVKVMQAIKDRLKSLMPKKLLYYYFLYKAKKSCNYDIRRRVYDKVYNNSDIEKVQRDLTLAYHIVEKGLTMPIPRPGFGKKVVISLCDTILKYEKMNLPLNDLEFKQSVSVITEYFDYHKDIDYKLDEDVDDKVKNIVSKFKGIEGLKQKNINKDEYFQDTDKPFDVFCRSRYSVRNYTNESIPMSVLYDCIDLAQKSPSFCNRQPTRVHIAKSSTLKNSILDLQNGNRGFGHLAETLLVITSVISTTKDIHERNENHLNGGMFIMTLLNALHFNKIGACSLNWSVTNDKDVKLRNLLNVPENEVILMIISCGYVPEKLALASSPRKTAREITTEHL
jgi:nitroreductase